MTSCLFAAVPLSPDGRLEPHRAGRAGASQGACQLRVQV